MVKRGDSINATRRQFESIGNKQEQILFKIAEKLLRLVQNLYQCVVLELVLFHLHFKDFEALITTSMFEHGMEPPPLTVCSRYVHTELQPPPLAEAVLATKIQYWAIWPRDSTKIVTSLAKIGRFSDWVRRLPRWVRADISGTA
jgi:hypothetical protein